MDKVLLITGATGIAGASARLAMRRGARVFVISLDEGDCRALGCEYETCDLTDAPRVEAAVARCLSVCGGIDGVFNVAGVSGRRFGDGPVHECTDEGWDTTINTNLRSMFLVNRAALRHMLPRKQGAILNMSSVLAFAPSPEHFATHAYAASKAAIIGLTKAMAASYAPRGIRVNCIAPGLVATPMSRRATGSEAIPEFIRGKQPLTAGMLTAEQIAEVALFLLSDAAGGITGQVITVDGGWTVS